MKYAALLVLLIPLAWAQQDCSAYVTAAETALHSEAISYPGFYVVAQNYWDAARCYKASDASGANRYYTEAAKYYVRAADQLVAAEFRNKGLSYELAAEAYAEMGDTAAMRQYYSTALTYFSSGSCGAGTVCADDVLRVNRKLAGTVQAVQNPVAPVEYAKTPDRYLLLAALVALFTSAGSIPIVLHYSRRKASKDEEKYRKLADTGKLG